MPLRLLKRNCKQYNVVSKSTFVISVELLDNGIMECTLDADSTGKDCLLNISQRLGLHQPEFFGLRYISKGVPPRVRWVSLDLPLRKQLEKHAQDSQLSLGVMFYVNDVNLLKDEMSRYHYFLQLKSDVIDGKLNCSIEQAISLAAYSLQAEFGDYEPERHSTEYLRDFAILPKDLTSEQKYPQINVDGLYEAVVRQYSSLIGFPPPLSEIYYIMVAQQLDGYGQEAYPAKDDAGNDILICVSANGLVIRRRDWTHIAAFRWSDIKSLIGHKKLFVVESSQSHRTMQYHFTDAEVAKYVRKMCLLQSTFCKENMHPEPTNNDNSLRSNTSVQYEQVVNDIPGYGLLNTGVSPPDLIATNMSGSTLPDGSSYSLNHSSSFNHSHHSGLGSSLNSSGFNLQVLPPQLQYSNGGNNTMQMNPHQLPLYRHQGELAAGTEYMNHHMQLMNSTIVRTNPLAAMTNMSTTASGSEISDINSAMNGYGRAMEAVSDYAAALQQKYGNAIPDLSVRKTSSQLYFSNQAKSSSEEEPIYQNDIVSQIHSMEIRDSLQNSTTEINGNGSLNGSNSYLQPASEDDTPLYVFKPPPPYPGLASTAANANSVQQQNKDRAATERNFDSSSNNSDSNTSLAKDNTVCSGISQLSPSATSSVVSAQVHTEPQKSNNDETGVSSSKDGESRVEKEMKQLQDDDEKNGNTEMSKREDVSSTRDDVSKIMPAANGNEQDQPAVVPSNSAAQKEIIISNENISATTTMNRPGQLFGKPIDPSVLREFLTIAKTKNNPSFATALKRENSKRNRSPDILPYEDNAIRLNPSRQNASGYINASPLSVLIGEKQWTYIVSQLPLNGNGSSLWQMVWESNIKVIVSLERDSSAPFYPLQKGASMNFNEFQIVESKGERRSSASIAREFTLVYVPKKKQRKVWVLPYEEEWREDVPIHTEHFLCFLEEVNSIQRKVSDPNSPLTVLCGTGAGRSGIFILSDLLLHAADCGHKLRCDTLLSELRTQRMCLVSTASQYAFVLHTLAKYLAQSRLI